MRRLITVSLAFLILNAVYLAAFPSPTIFYMANVLLHLGVGLVLMVAAIPLALRYPRESGAFVLAGIPALYLAVRGNTLPHQWILIVHIAFSLGFVAMLATRFTRVRVPLMVAAGLVLAAAIVAAVAVGTWWQLRAK